MNEYMFSRAVEWATHASQKTNGYRYKHGAVIFDKLDIISIGYNKQKHTSTLYKYGYKRCWLHAESDAILSYSRILDLHRYSILVIRKSKTKLSSSKPCESCMALIREVGIRTVYYSDKDGFIKKMKI